MKIRINLLDRKYSIYKQKRSFGKCEMCNKYKINYQAQEVIDADGNQVPYWTCTRCMPNEMWEYYFI